MALPRVPPWTIPFTTMVMFVNLGGQLFIANQVVISVLTFAVIIWVGFLFTSTIRKVEPREFFRRWPFVRRIEKESSPDSKAELVEVPIVKE